MKNLVFASALLLSSVAAHADFNTDALEATVTCKVAGGGAVSINKQRSIVSLILQPPQAAHNGFYPVAKRESDGDTFASYLAGKLVLTFSDRGDQLELDGAVLDLKCP